MKRKKPSGKILIKLKKGAVFIAGRILFAGICLLCLRWIVFLAENGSEVFYYAMAFASPGSTVEYLCTAPEDEKSPAFSAEVTPEEIPFRAGDFSLPPPEIIPEIPEENRGKVTEICYFAEPGGVYIPFGKALIRNCTKLSTGKIEAMLGKEHSLSLSTGDPSLPQVLVYHTHATESFEPDGNGYFDLSEDWRSTDPDENMIAVGDVLTSVLTEKGIGVIHSGTMHDDPGYTGSYQRSAATVSTVLDENPGIKVCLDLHRDAIEPSEKEIIRPAVLINGKKAAQIMIIAGCDDGSMNMPDYAENLRFAAALGDKLEELFPGICRPILFDYRKYNMDLSPGLLLIEIGATGNTLDEAKYSAELLGIALAELLAE